MTMPSMHGKWCRNILMCSILLAAGAGALANPLSAELTELTSRVQSMSQGYFAVAEWNRVFGDLDVLSAKAEQQKDWGTMLDARLLKALVLNDLLNDPERALAVVQQTKRKLQNIRVPGYSKLYVREADIYARLGDEFAISRLIEDFKKSPHYDPQPYTYSGGQGRDVPLVITRPGGRGDDSLTVTAMEVARQRARSAAGRAFPEFELVDARGRAIRSADYRGKVVLVDFWLQGWTPWERDVPSLVRTYKEYRGQGFEIIGINLERDTQGVESFAKRQGMTWPQVVGDQSLPRRLGIFGEATNYLLDRSGNVIGRNLRGADLLQAVRAALGPSAQ